MAYLILNPDNSIQDVVPEFVEGSVEVTAAEMQSIISSNYGHAIFDYIDGQIILNQDRLDAIEFAILKAAGKEAVIKNKMRELAEANATAELAQIDGAQTLTALKSVLQGVGGLSQLALSLINKII